MIAAKVRADHAATLRLVFSYALFACVWILLSDQLVVWIFQNPAQIAAASSLKGWFFVAVTSVLLYGLIQRNLHQVHQSLRQESAARAHSAQAHELLSAIVESTEDAIFAKDLQGRYILFNQAACAFVGKTREQVLGLDDRAIFPPAQADMLMELGRRAVAENSLQTTEEQLSTAQGERIFLATKGPLSDSGGVVFGTFGISREITGQKQLLQRLRSSEERLLQANQDLQATVAQRSQELLDLYNRTPAGGQALAADGTVLRVNQFLNGVLEVLPFGVVVLNQAHQVVLHNQLFGTLLDYPESLLAQAPLHYPELLRYNHLRGDYPGATLDSVLERFDQLSQSRQSSSFERLQASGIYLQVRGQAIASQWTLLTFTDVSVHKAAEQSLQSARQVAEAATLAKSTFLAHMSHEIRTPMNGILGLAYLLEKAPLPPAAAALARQISHTGQSLQGILNDILDFSKIEAGHLTLEQTGFALGDVLDSVASSMVGSPAQAALELAISPPPVGLQPLLGDPLRLGQVLGNLVGNAIKFTPTGHVRLAVTRLQATAQGATLLFAVSDSGIGIAAEELEEIFKPFSQADASTTRRFGGTGLGLAISRRLVERMGGTLQVQSTPGQGSEFWFTLHLPWAARAEPAAPRMQGLEVLIADDSAISRDALRATTLGLGWKASVVDGGQAALQRVLQRQQQQGAPQVLLLDWKMPDLDGLAVARAVNKALRGTQGPILILATAYSREALLAQPDSQLIDAVLSKPVTPSSLYDAVLLALEKRRGGSLQPGPQDRQRLLGLRLLVVDDSEVNRDIAQLIFAGEGASVQRASNGQEALDWLQAHPDAIDLVLMDVQMPVMDGVQATRRLRALPALAALPVVALTAGAYQANREAALAAGMNEHLSKPMDVERAIATILRLTGRTQSGLAPQALRLPTETGAADARLPGLDLQRGLAIWRDASVYQQYLRKFVRDYADCLDPLPALDSAARLALAHKLRGAAGNLALDPVAAAAAEWEEQLKQGLDTHDALQRLQAALLQACSTVAAYAGSAATGNAPGAPQPADLAPLLGQTLRLLGGDSPEGLEPLLASLEAALPTGQAIALRQAVENFNFRAAETAVHALALSLQLHLPLPLTPPPGGHRMSHGPLLIVDDEPHNLAVMRQVLGAHYRLVFACSAADALAATHKHRPALILLDIQMPDMSGYEVCRRLKADARTEGIPVIFVTAMSDVGNEAQGFALGAVDYIVKPVYPAIVLARVRAQLSLVRATQLEQSWRDAISMLGEAAHFNDTDTGVHIWRMAAYAAALARASGWVEEDWQRLELAAPMHDTGKLGVPQALLQKPGPLSADEWLVMKTHPRVGHDILARSASPVFQLAAEIALQHHEKWDGSGYPQGLQGQAIAEAARLVAVADVFDALTMQRPYKAAWPIAQVVATIQAGRGQHFEPRLSDLFISILPEILRIKAHWDQHGDML